MTMNQQPISFLFWVGNHILLGQRSLEDVMQILCHQLREMGHWAAWDPKNSQFLLHGIEPDSVFWNKTQPLPAGRGYNVVVEGFTPAVVAEIARYHAMGSRFICLATEEPTPTGFNHGTTREMRERQEDFHLVAPYLDAIWHLVPGRRVTDWYSQFAPTSYVELGYARGLVRSSTERQLRGAPVTEPRYSFGFYGSLSRRRENLLKKICRRRPGTQIRVVADFATAAARDAAMQEAKVVLQIRKFDQMGLVSSSRCNTSLNIGRPVVAEPHELSKPWDEVVSFSDTEEEFIAKAFMTAGAWRGVHHTQFDRFRSKLTPDYCVGRALRETGLVGSRAAA